MLLLLSDAYACCGRRALALEVRALGARALGGETSACGAWLRLVGEAAGGVAAA